MNNSLKYFKIWSPVCTRWIPFPSQQISSCCGYVIHFNNLFINGEQYLITKHLINLPPKKNHKQPFIFLRLRVFNMLLCGEFAPEGWRGMFKCVCTHTRV